MSVPAPRMKIPFYKNPMIVGGIAAVIIIVTVISLWAAGVFSGGGKKYGKDIDGNFVTEEGYIVMVDEDDKIIKNPEDDSPFLFDKDEGKIIDSAKTTEDTIVYIDRAVLENEFSQAEADAEADEDDEDAAEAVDFIQSVLDSLALLEEKYNTTSNTATETSVVEYPIDDDTGYVIMVDENEKEILLRNNSSFLYDEPNDQFVLVSNVGTEMRRFDVLEIPHAISRMSPDDKEDVAFGNALIESFTTLTGRNLTDEYYNRLDDSEKAEFDNERSNEPSADETSADETSVDKTSVEEPVKMEPAKMEPVKMEPVKMEPVVAPAPVDCEVSWGPWSACVKLCGAEVQTRTYTVTTEPANGGKACPARSQSRACPGSRPECNKIIYNGPGPVYDGGENINVNFSFYTPALTKLTIDGRLVDPKGNLAWLSSQKADSGFNKKVSFPLTSDLKAKVKSGLYKLRLNIKAGDKWVQQTTGTIYDMSAKPLAPPKPVARDCEVSAWGEWEADDPQAMCDKMETRRRTIKTGPANGGKACPTDLVETRRNPATNNLSCDKIIMDAQYPRFNGPAQHLKIKSQFKYSTNKSTRFRVNTRIAPRDENDINKYTWVGGKDFDVTPTGYYELTQALSSRAKTDAQKSGAQLHMYIAPIVNNNVEWGQGVRQKFPIYKWTSGNIV